MTDPKSWSNEDLLRQTRQHLESLRRAGVEWLPIGAPVEAAVPVSESPAGGLFNRDSLAAVGTLDERRHALTVLAETVAGCTRCPELVASRTQTVFGVGPLDAEVCFVGEAPGADEDAQGEPFVGAAGQLLNRIIAACGFKREEVYIMNTLKCRPPGNRTPLPNELANCRGYFDRQIDLVQPKFLCALGATAAQSVLATNQPLGRLRGRFHDYRGIPVLVTYHPAFLLPHRSPGKKRDVWEDMKVLLRRMGRTIPGAVQ